MVDYEGLRALDAVIRHQSFGGAAKELFITQSAVSQRLSHLEAFAGRALLIRELPYHATPLGERMLALLRQVTLLEQTFESERNSAAHARSLVKLAVNLDSLELWFSGVLEDKSLAKDLNLAIIADDEKYTLRHLKAGKVDLCISAVAAPIQNHEAQPLGGMSYFLVSTPEFKAKYFPRGLKRNALSASPAVIFDEKDDLHHRFLREELGFEDEFPYTAVPSVRGYQTAVLAGYGYAVIPLLQIESQLRSGELVKLQPRPIVRELYLHYWNAPSPILKRVIESVCKAARRLR